MSTAAGIRAELEQRRMDALVRQTSAQLRGQDAHDVQQRLRALRADLARLNARVGRTRMPTARQLFAGLESETLVRDPLPELDTLDACAARVSDIQAALVDVDQQIATTAGQLPNLEQELDAARQRLRQAVALRGHVIEREATRQPGGLLRSHTPSTLSADRDLHTAERAEQAVLVRRNAARGRLEHLRVQRRGLVDSLHFARRMQARIEQREREAEQRTNSLLAEIRLKAGEVRLPGVEHRPGRHLTSL